MKSFWCNDPKVWSSEMLHKRYKVVYADPPWKTFPTDTRRARHQLLLNAIDLASLPVRELVDDDAFLALWWPASQPLEALQVMKEWGFRLLSMNGLTWIRQGREKAESELCLFAVRGDGLKHVRDWSLPRIVHGHVTRSSQRPLEAQLLLDRIIPAMPRLELFMDSGRMNWESWMPRSSELPS
ncbi:MAG: MT-A70 family methyltransferase [Opitutaceae bacterium]